VPELKLVTLPFSHFCEKARWALDRAGLAYREEAHMPMLSWIAARRAGGGRTLPVLVTPRRPIADSTEILAWCDAHGDADALFPTGPLGDEVRALEDDFDLRLGPHARRLAYAAALPSKDAARAAYAYVPSWQARTVEATYPIVVRLMSRLLKIDAAGVARSRTIVDATFAAVGARLADGRRYLTGDRFTAADLTFASLAAPVLGPAQYGGPLPPRDTWPADFASYVDGLRATPAGRFALALYAERAPSCRA
jgi:glutathione S-transferase